MELEVKTKWARWGWWIGRRGGGAVRGGGSGRNRGEGGGNGGMVWGWKRKKRVEGSEGGEGVKETDNW